MKVSQSNNNQKLWEPSEVTAGKSYNLTLYHILTKGHITYNYPQSSRVSDGDSFILFSTKIVIIYSLQQKMPKLSTWPTSIHSRLSNKTYLQPGPHFDKKKVKEELVHKSKLRNWLPYQERKKKVSAKVCALY